MATPCGYDDNIMAEALHGGARGGGIEPRNTLSGCRPCVCRARQYDDGHYASPRVVPRGLRLSACAQACMHESREIPAVTDGPCLSPRAVKAKEGEASWTGAHYP